MRGLWFPPTLALIAVVLLGGAAAPKPAAPAGSSTVSVEAPAPAAHAPIAGTDAELLEPLADFLGEPADVDAVAAARYRGYEVEVLLATLPDPIHTSLGFMFDRYLDAVRTAIEQEGYLLDRFRIPWKSPREADTAKPRCDEEPVVVLFRHQSERRVLILLVAGELPTSGLHTEAFVRAVRIGLLTERSAPPRGDGPRELRIVGPSFSGSAQSLVRGLGRAVEELGAGRSLWRFRVMTGSATSQRNAGVFAEARAELGLAVSFSATVHNDDVLERVMCKHLREHFGRKERRLAFLHESNTAYGSAFAADEVDDAGVCGKVMALPFPLHIADLRGELDADAAKASKSKALVESASRQHRLSLGVERDGDQLPQTSEISRRSMELVLANILETLRSESIRDVGIIATDPRDVVFLAKQVRESCPNIRMFLFSGDNLFTHMDATALQGSTIVSSYPLCSDNQRWSYPFAGRGARLLFPTDTAQGVYNATALLLARARPPAPGPSCAERLRVASARVLEYGMPLERRAEWTAPAIWLSAVGSGRLFPLTAESAGVTGGVEREWNGRARGDGRLMSPRLPVGYSLVVSVATLVSLLACWLRWRARDDAQHVHSPAVELFSDCGDGYVARTFRSRAIYRVFFFLVLYATLSALTAVYLLPGICASPGLGLLDAAAAIVNEAVHPLDHSTPGRLEIVTRLARWRVLLGAIAVLTLGFLFEAQLMAAPWRRWTLRGWRGFGSWRAWVWRGLKSLPSRVRRWLEREVELLAAPLALAGVASVGAREARQPREERADSVPPGPSVPGLTGKAPAGERARRAGSRVIGPPTLAFAWTTLGVTLWLVAFQWLLASGQSHRLEMVFFIERATSFSGGLTPIVTLLAMAVGFVVLLGTRLHGVGLTARFVAADRRPCGKRWSDVLFQSAATGNPDSVRNRLESRLGNLFFVRGWVAMGIAVVICWVAALASRRMPVPYETLFFSASTPLLQFCVFLFYALMVLNVVRAVLLWHDWRDLLGRLGVRLNEDDFKALSPLLRARFSGPIDQDTFEVWEAERLAPRDGKPLAIEAVIHASYIRKQIETLMGAVTGCLLLALVVVSSYPFQRAQVLVTLTWVAVAVFALGTAVVLMQMNRDSVTSWISGGTAGKVNLLDRDLLKGLGFHSVLPVLGLIASQFPSFGWAVSSWFDPILQAFSK